MKLRLSLLLFLIPAAAFAATVSNPATAPDFPRDLAQYHDPEGAGLWQVLVSRIEADPFNLVAAIIFGLAIIHTFLTSRFRHWAHEVEERHAVELKARGSAVGGVRSDEDDDGQPDEVSFKGQILHFFGEVEAVFGLWVVVLIGAIIWMKDWETVKGYIGSTVNFTEPMFVVIIMAIASTRPVLRFAEQCMRTLASCARCSTGAWWLSILITAPILGSFITEPAAMTIGAMLLARQFYTLKPSPRFAYGTIGLLFVNISVGGTLTHFAAPPVLMVAHTWNWDLPFMFVNFGWKAVLGIVVSTMLYYLFFRKEFAALDERRAQAATEGSTRKDGGPIPAWITTVQLLFMAVVVYVAHEPPLFIGAFLFFLAFSRATAHHQGRLDLGPPMLVGFFLAGLVIHSGLQGWWIEPVLKSLTAIPLFLGATILTAFNDNAAITLLATLVPDFTDPLKYAVVAGAVTGGGLTVIANAPNPAGQSILQRYFPDGVSPLGLATAALIPTVTMGLCFMLL